MRAALTLGQKGAWEEACDLFARAKGLGPRELCHFARSLWECGREDEAWEVQGRADAAGSDLAWVLFSRGLLHLDAQEPEEASRHFEMSRSRDARNLLLPCYEALARFDSGLHREGLDQLAAHLLAEPPALQSRVAVCLERFLGPGRVTFVPYVLEASEEPEPAAFAAVNRYLMWPERAASAVHARFSGRGRAHRAVAEASASILTRDYDRAARLLEEVGDETAEELVPLRVEVALLRGDGPQALELALGDAPETQAFRAAAHFLCDQPDEALALLGELPEDLRRLDYTFTYLEGLCHLIAKRPRKARQTFEDAFRGYHPHLTIHLVREARLELDRRELPPEP